MTTLKNLAAEIVRLHGRALLLTEKTPLGIISQACERIGLEAPFARPELSLLACSGISRTS